jgi:hypothetical protein
MVNIKPTREEKLSTFNPINTLFMLSPLTTINGEQYDARPKTFLNEFNKTTAPIRQTEK